MFIVKFVVCSITFYRCCFSFEAMNVMFVLSIWNSLPLNVGLFTSLISIHSFTTIAHSHSLTNDISRILGCKNSHAAAVDFTILMRCDDFDY